MIEYIISYAIKAIIIYLYYTWAFTMTSNVIALILQLIAIWWLIDNVLTPMFNSEERNAFFDKVFSVDILNICISIYYFIAGVLFYIFYDYWKDLDSGWKKVGSLGVFMILYNRLYFAIISMADKTMAEGFCACSL